MLFGFIDQTVHDLPTVVVDQDRSVESRLLQTSCAPPRRSRSSRVTASPDAGAADDPRRARARRRRDPARLPRQARARRRGAGAGADRRLGLDRQRAGARQHQRPGRQRQRGPPRGRRARAGARSRRSRSSCSTPRGAPRTTSSPAWSRSCCRSSGIVLAAVAIVREREQGTLEQLLVTPINPLGLMLGKLAPVPGARPRRDGADPARDALRLRACRSAAASLFLFAMALVLPVRAALARPLDLDARPDADGGAADGADAVPARRSSCPATSSRSRGCRSCCA